MPASCPLLPHIVINELGLDVELIKVDHAGHKTATGLDFYGINPHGYVPVLELGDGNHMREGPAIVQSLVDLRPESGLAPAAGTMERYKLLEMLGFLSTEIQKGSFRFSMHGHREAVEPLRGGDSARQYRHLVLGAVGIFLYVGTDVSVRLLLLERRHNRPIRQFADHAPDR